MGPDISGKLVALMSELQFQFAMYNPETDTIEFNTGNGLQDYADAMNEFN